VGVLARLGFLEAACLGLADFFDADFFAAFSFDAAFLVREAFEADAFLTLDFLRVEVFFVAFFFTAFFFANGVPLEPDIARIIRCGSARSQLRLQAEARWTPPEGGPASKRFEELLEAPQRAVKCNGYEEFSYHSGYSDRAGLNAFSEDYIARNPLNSETFRRVDGIRSSLTK
jgi:hypothetical protein